MPFEKDSLQVLKNRIYSNYLSLYKPIDKTARYNLLSVFANVDAGLFHLLHGDIEFFSKQLFPDTAEGAYLRAHWSSRVAPLYAAAARGTVVITGSAGTSIPAGTVFKNDSGKKYFTEKKYVIADNGSIIAEVKAEDAGSASNISAGSSLSIISAIPSGAASTVTAGGNGILGGTDAESDAQYLMRVLAHLRNLSAYGKNGDYAQWTLNSTSEVSSAWEFKDFGVFGALLIQVIGGNQMTGIFNVANLTAVRGYINTVSPPVVFEVRTPFLIPVNPEIILPPNEDTVENRELTETRLKTYLQYAAAPGISLTAGALRPAIIDGVKITNVTVKINNDAAGIMPFTILEYPVLGEILWQ